MPESQHPMTAGELADALVRTINHTPGARRWEIVIDGAKVTGLDYDIWTEHPHFELTRSS